MKTRIFFLLIVGMMILTLWQPQTANAQERYREGDYVFTVWRELTDGIIRAYAMIIDYTGPGGNVQIPSMLDGIPVIAILDGAFHSKGLTSVSIPNSVTGIGPVLGIGAEAFSGNQLTSVTIPNGITHIGEAAFAENQLTNVSLPSSLTHIGDGAFAANRLTSVNIPNGVTYIGFVAFARNQLTNVTIPNSVTHIGVQAFAMNRLTSVTVPSGAQIGVNAFSGNGPNSDREATVTRR